MECEPLESTSAESRRRLQQGSTSETLDNETRVDEQIERMRRSLQDAAQLAGNDATESLSLPSRCSTN
ncbi:MAG: hypothetical protein R3B96_09985 [Pirellulaceae bacterium]